MVMRGESVAAAGPGIAGEAPPPSGIAAAAAALSRMRLPCHPAVGLLAHD